MSGPSTALSLPKRVAISLVLLVCGLLVFVLGTNYYSIFPTNDSQLYRAILAAAFLVAAVLLRRHEATRAYGDIAYAFCIGTTTYLLTSLTAGPRDDLLRSLDIPFETPRHLAIVKLFEAVQVIGLILLLSWLWGWNLGCLYLKRGRLGLGLFVGLCMLLINTATGIVTGAALGTAGEELVARLPWVLLFSLANGLMEELLFRGLFLRKFIPQIGLVGAIVVTSVVFTVMHSAATYMNPLEAILFQVIIFPMALLFSYLIYKTDSLWGSALFHAGSDVFLLYLTVL